MLIDNIDLAPITAQASGSGASACFGRCFKWCWTTASSQRRGPKACADRIGDTVELPLLEVLLLIGLFKQQLLYGLVFGKATDPHPQQPHTAAIGQPSRR